MELYNFKLYNKISKEGEALKKVIVRKFILQKEIYFVRVGH